MAHLHFKRTVYKSGGAAATHRLAYITRQPAHELNAAERQLRYIKDGREDLVYERSRNLPTWARDNPHIYFQAAERHEGTNRVAFEEWKISLLQEFSHRQNMALTKDLVDAIAGDTLPCTYAFHDPTTMDGSQQQPHLHLLISARQTDTHTRTPAQHCMRYNRTHPERGGAEKDPAFWHRGAVKAHRVLVSDILNVHLERAGLAMRVHPDSLLDRGLDRQPEPKLLPSESRQYREHGIVSERMQQVLQVRAERQQSLAEEQRNARVYWLARTMGLGISPQMSHEDRLERIVQAREHAISHAPERRRVPVQELAAQVQTLERSIADLERYTYRLERAHARDRVYVEPYYHVTREYTWGIEKLLAEGKEHGLPRDLEAEKIAAAAQAWERLQTPRHGRSHGLDLADDTPRHGLQARVFRKERDPDRDRGMGW